MTYLVESDDQNMQSDNSFFNPKFFLHTPFGLPVLQNSLTYSSNNKSIIADFKFDNKLITDEKFPLEIIIKDKIHNFTKIIDIEIEKKEYE